MTSHFSSLQPPKFDTRRNSSLERISQKILAKTPSLPSLHSGRNNVTSVSQTLSKRPMARIPFKPYIPSLYNQTSHAAGATPATVVEEDSYSETMYSNDHKAA